ncbi:MAG: helix-turn-helix transcriptional regulator [Azoarcus sp.]|nr:helix-turn-helix transcriptional regulator [Azoarcus sp.]
MTNKADLPTTLRALRTRLALTQEQLAARLGVSFATDNRWEAGTSKPQRAQAEAIAALVVETGIEGEAAESGVVPLVPRRARSRVTGTTPTTKPMEQRKH